MRSTEAAADPALSGSARRGGCGLVVHQTTRRRAPRDKAAQTPKHITTTRPFVSVQLQVAPPFMQPPGGPPSTGGHRHAHVGVAAQLAGSGLQYWELPLPGTPPAKP